MSKHHNPNRVLFITGACVLAGFAAIGTVIYLNPKLLDIFSIGGKSAEVTLSRELVEETVVEVRKVYKDKWQKKNDEIRTFASKILALREEALEKVRSDPQLGESYRDSLLRLAQNKHLVVGTVPPVKDVYNVFEVILANEKIVVNATIDIFAARNAYLSKVSAMDAVAMVKIVPPQRLMVSRTALMDTPITSVKGAAMFEFRTAIKTGSSEIDAMVKNARSIIERINASDNMLSGTAFLTQGAAMGSLAGQTLRPDQLSISDKGASDGGFNAKAGRIISKQGLKKSNFYIDTWYIMGPFDNKYQTNINASFLPESDRDLDTQTIGMMPNLPLRWVYVRSPRQRIEPDFSNVPNNMAPNDCVYYGRAEIWVEDAGKYFVSVGSDDFGKLWVNGKKIWESRKEAKSYRADEETLEIDFVKGVNDLLFRCTNRGGTMGWSVVFQNE